MGTKMREAQACLKEDKKVLEELGRLPTMALGDWKELDGDTDIRSEWYHPEDNENFTMKKLKPGGVLKQQTDGAKPSQALDSTTSTVSMAQSHTKSVTPADDRQLGFRFLELPSEIRILIYQYLFSLPEFIIPYHGEGALDVHPARRNCRTYETCRPYLVNEAAQASLRPRDRVWPPINPPCVDLYVHSGRCPLWFHPRRDIPSARVTAILYTNRAIHDEAIGVLYSSTTFSFLSFIHYLYFSDKITRVGRVKISSVCILMPSAPCHHTAAWLAEELPGVRTLLLASRRQESVPNHLGHFWLTNRARPLPDYYSFLSAAASIQLQEIYAEPGPTVNLPPALQFLRERSVQLNKVFHLRLIRVSRSRPLAQQ
ncbi:MAG: hypothetical protein M1823_004110 [Watsoniomyces obsoletus]|nr:MAG: hypothetical protein M1823_004110 [Watsoniomyces obsoletus]